MSAAAVPSLRVLAARAQQAVGWPGVTGVALMLVATAWLALSWRAHVEPPPSVEVPALMAQGGTQEAPVPAPINLPTRADLPLLLTQIQQTAVSNGLAWAAADYKVTAATETALATLEVRSSLKGSYPMLRAAVAQLLRGVPGLTLREFSLSRANSDTAEVDAKLTLLVFLQDEIPTGGPAAMKVSP